MCKSGEFIGYIASTDSNYCDLFFRMSLALLNPIMNSPFRLFILYFKKNFYFTSEKFFLEIE